MKMFVANFPTNIFVEFLMRNDSERKRNDKIAISTNNIRAHRANRRHTHSPLTHTTLNTQNQCAILNKRAFNMYFISVGRKGAILWQ